MKNLIKYTIGFISLAIGLSLNAQSVDLFVQETSSNTLQVFLVARGQDFNSESSNWNDYSFTLAFPLGSNALSDALPPENNYVVLGVLFGNSFHASSRTPTPPVSTFSDGTYNYYKYSNSADAPFDVNYEIPGNPSIPTGKGVILPQNKPVMICQIDLNGNSIDDLIIGPSSSYDDGSNPSWANNIANYSNVIYGIERAGIVSTSPNILFADNSLNQIPNGGAWFFGSGSNFEPGSDASKNVQIAHHGASISGAADINNLTIESDGSLDINPGASLNVNGTATNLANADSLMLRADGTGYAQYLGPAIAGTYEQYIDGSAGWRYISSPVDGNTINELNFSQPFTVVTDGSNAQNVWAYNPTTAQWGPGGTTTISDNGVNVYFQSSELPMTISTSGTLNAGKGSTRNLALSDGAPSDSSTGNGANTFWNQRADGWNLIANPYPSALDIESMNFGGGADNSIYIWNVDKGNWATYVKGTGAFTNEGSRYVAPMNAFYVRTDGAATMGFTDAGAIASASFLKAPIEFNGLYMTVFNPMNMSDEVFVGFDFNATKSFDKELDAFKMLSTNINAPNLATGQDLLAINNLPEMYGGDQYTIPVVFESALEGMHKFTWDMSSLDYDVEVYLEDKVEGIMYPLDGNDYEFNHTSTDRKDRFVLHFNRGVVSDEPFADDSNFNMWMGWENTVNVEFAQDGIADISITNMMGQVIITDSNIDMSETYQIQIPNATSAAIYVVTITTSNGDQYTQKLLAR